MVIPAPAPVSPLPRQAADHIAADLFCGAGGTSSGLLEAASELGLQIKLIAVNHWDVAIATHAENHPFADHYCEAVENLDPRKVVPQGYLRLLVASPECRYHSNARGGRAINDQLRTSPWDILRWMEALYMLDILFRMLLPNELAAAQVFLPGYRFQGKREDIVKQIGNAVPRNLARALCRVLLLPSQSKKVQARQ